MAQGGRSSLNSPLRKWQFTASHSNVQTGSEVHSAPTQGPWKVVTLLLRKDYRVSGFKAKRRVKFRNSMFLSASCPLYKAVNFSRNYAFPNSRSADGHFTSKLGPLDLVLHTPHFLNLTWVRGSYTNAAVIPTECL